MGASVSPRALSTATRRRRRSRVRGVAALFCLWICFVSSVCEATLSATAVVPASLVAGERGHATVAFTSDTDILVGSSIEIEFPSAFALDTSASTILIDGARFATTLSITRITPTAVVGTVGVASISANVPFEFTISDVANQGAGTTEDFQILVKDSNENAIDEDVHVPAVTIRRSEFIGTSSIVPDSLVAGVVGKASVSFKSGVELPVGSVIELTFPAEFSIAATTALSDVSSGLDTGSVATSTPLSNKIRVVVGVSAVSAGSLVSFKVSGVRNPGVTRTGDFALVTLDSLNRVYASDTSIAPVDIVISAFAAASSIVPDSLVAGVVGKASVSFKSGVELPVGSVIELTFPAEFSIAATTALSDVSSGLDTGSVATSTPLSNKIRVVVGVSAVSAGSLVSFKVSGVRNPGVTRTGDFALVTLDSLNRVYASDTSIAPVDIVISAFAAASSIVPDSLVAGVVGKASVSFKSGVELPVGSVIELTFPAEFSIAATTALSDVSSGLDTGSVATSTPLSNKIRVVVGVSAVSAGSLVSFKVSGVRNPGVTRTGDFALVTLDSLNRVYASDTSIAPVDIVISAFAAASSIVPDSLVAGVVGKASVSFKSGVELPVGSVIELTFPAEFSIAATTALSDVSSGLDTGSVATSTPLSNKIRVVVGVSAVSAGSLVSFKVSGVRNPGVTRTGDFALVTLDSLNRVYASDTSIAPVDIVISAFAAASSIVPDSLVAGVVGKASVSFKSGVELPVGSVIELTFPAEFSIAATTALSDVSSGLDTGSVATSTPLSNKIRVVVGVSAVSAGSLVSFKVSGVRNPGVTRTGDFALVTLDSLNRVYASDTSIAPVDIVISAFAAASSIVPDSLVAGVVGKASVSFKSGVELPVGSVIELTFPAEFSIAATTALSDVSSGLDTGSVATSTPLSNKIRVVVGVSAVSAGSLVSFKVSGVRNPGVTRTGDFALVTLDSLNRVYASDTSIAPVDIVISAFAAASSIVPDSLVAGVVGKASVSFKSGVELPVGSVIELTFPAEFSIAATTALSDVSSGLDTGSVATSTPLSNKIRVVVGVSAVSAGSLVSFKVSGVRNPGVTRTGDFALVTLDSLNRVYASDTSIAPVDIVISAFAAASSIVPDSLVAGVVGKASVSFKSGVELPVGSVIELTFPAEFSIAATTALSDVSSGLDTGSVATSTPLSNKIRVVVGVSAVSAGSLVSFKVSGVRNPGVTRTGDFALVTLDSLNRVYASDTSIAPVDIVISAFAAASSIVPDSLVAGVVGKASVSFKSGVELPVGSVIELTFPAEFSIAATTALSDVSSGLDTGSVATSTPLSNKIRVVVGVSAVSAGSLVSFKVSGVRNPGVTRTGDFALVTLDSLNRVYASDTSIAPVDIVISAFAAASSIVPDSLVAGVVGKASVSFKSGVELPVGSVIELTFPAEFSIAATTALSDVSSGLDTGSVATSTPLSNKIRVVVGVSAVSAGSLVSFKVSGVRNPGVTRTGDFALVTLDSLNRVYASDTSIAPVDIVISAFAAASSIVPDSLVAGVVGKASVSFKSGVELPVGSVIELTFPAEFSIAATTALSDVSSGLDTGSVATSTPLSNKIRVVVGVSAVSAGSLVSFKVSGVRNPGVTRTGDFALVTLDSLNRVYASDTSIAPVDIVISAFAAASSIVPDSLVAGVVGKASVSFKSGVELPVGSVIELTFPAEFSIAATTALSDVSSGLDTGSVATSTPLSNKIRVVVGVSAVSAGSLVSFKVSGVRNPGVTRTGDFALVTLDSLNRVYASDTSIAPVDIVISAFAAASSIVPDSLVAGVVGKASVSFKSGVELPVGSVIELTFPAEFSIAATTALSDVSSGLDTGSVATSTPLSNKIRVVVGVSAVSAGSLVSFKVSGVRNPGVTRTGDFALVTLDSLNRVYASDTSIAPVDIVISAFAAASSIVPDSLVAGVVGKASVSFKSGVELPVGSVIELTFPAEFSIAATTALSDVSSGLDTGSVATSTPLSNKIRVVVGVSAVSAGSLVSFKVSGVRNPGVTRTGDFALVTLDSLNRVYASDTSIAPVDIVISAFAAASSIVPDSLVAGVVGKASVSFKSGVELPVGSVIELTFPAEFSIAATTALSDVSSGLDTGSVATSTPLSNKIRVVVGVSAVSAGSLVSFKVSGVRNPGVTRTGDFALVTLDSLNRVYASDTSIAPVDIVISAFAAASSIVPDSLVAGVVGKASVSFKSGVELPVGSVIELTFPAEFSIAATTALSDVSSGLDTGSVATSTPLSNKIRVVVGVSAVSAGSLVSFKVSGVRNPGVTRTGDFALVTLDSLNRVYASDTSIAPVDIVISAFAAASSIVPDSLVAGVVGKASVSFKSGVELPVGSVIELTFPAEFSIAATTALSDVSSGLDTGSVATSTPLSNKIRVVVGVSAVSAGSLVSFKVSGVRNPGVTRTGDFALVTLDSLNRVYASDTSIAPVDIVISAFAAASSIVPDSLVAGVVGKASVSFKSGVELPVGSVIELTFPAEFSIAATTALSDVSSGLDTGSVATSTPLSNKIRVVVGVSAVSAGSSVSFKVSGVRNPGVTRTGDFALVTLDSLNRVYASDTSIAPVDISSSTLVSAVGSVSTVEAGVRSVIGISFTCLYEVPIAGKIVLFVPAEVFVSVNAVLAEDGDAFRASGASVMKTGQVITFTLNSAVPAGSYVARVSGIYNPGVTTTGMFGFQTADSAGRPIETASLPGFTTTAGDVTNARMSASNPHPGIVSAIQLSFVTPAALLDDTLVYVALANDDYSFAVAKPTIVVRNPPATTASITWDSPENAFAVILSSTDVIPESSVIEMTITAFKMPPSIRSATTATIQTWNALGLRLDGPSTLTIDPVTAVTTLSVKWTTRYPYPGITSPSLLLFDTNGALSAGGKIKLEFPNGDISAKTFTAPSVIFQNPSASQGTLAWDAATGTFLITLDTAPSAAIPAYSTAVQLTITSLDTPTTVRSAARIAWMSTLDSSGVVIDGPCSITLDAIVAGPILGSRMWIPTRRNPGITTDHTISFYSNGKVDGGGYYDFVLPDTKWSVATDKTTASFLQPPLGQMAAVTWQSATRTMRVTLTGSTTVPAYSQVTLSISGVITPPKETSITTAYVTTHANDGSVIDGPGTVSIEAISRGSFGGMKSLQTTTTASASMVSKQKLLFTLNGALPSGSVFTVRFPSTGWRRESSSILVSFLAPSSGVRVASAVWSADPREITITTEGDLAEATAVELSIDGMINPFDVESAAEASLLYVKSALADGGVVDESFDIQINAIAAADLGSSATWVSTVATPGVVSTHVMQITTGGQLEPSASVCITFPAADAWTVLNVATASVAQSALAESKMGVAWSPAISMLCLSFVVSVPQSASLTITVTNVRTPPSERSEATAIVTFHSHLGGLVSVGQMKLNAIARGFLSGERKWQSALFSPGPVASLVTTATLTFTTTGQITPAGTITLTLPVEWEIATICAVDFIKPTVFGIATCLKNTVTISMLDTINEYIGVQILVRAGVINPPTVLPPGVAFIQTKAPDGGVIDESASVTTGAIESALLDIVCVDEGDTRVAVVGASKTFLFQGFSVNGGDTLKFVDATTTSDTNCGTAVTGVSDVGGIEIATLGASHAVTLRFMQSSLINQPFMLCYKFGSNPFKLYRNLAFTVKEVTSMTVSAGDVGVAVANYAKTWVFHGRGLADGDRVRWIDSSAVQDAVARGNTLDCLVQSTLARLITPTGSPLGPDEDDNTRRVGGASNDAVFMFSAPENSGKTFYLCYRFGNEPYKIYSSMAIEVRHVKAVQAAAWGHNAVAVVEYPKSFSFLGDGLAPNDRLYFIEVGSGATCAASAANPALRLSHTISDLVQSVLFLSSSSDTVLNFVPAAAGKRVMLCFQFATEPYQLYPDLQLDVKMVTSFVGKRGSPLLAVADVPEPLTFQGFGLTAGDQVRWIHSAEEDCDTHTAVLTDPVTFAPIDTQTIDIDQSSSFNFSSKQDDYRPVLCYKFGIEKFKLYANMDIKVATLTAKTTVDGSREVAIVGARKAFTLYGTHLAEGDRVSWTPYPLDTGCVNTSLLMRDPATQDKDYVSFMTTRSQFAVAFAAFSSGKRVYLCYGFGTEPYNVYHDLFLDVKSVRNMRTLRGANGVAVAGATKTFLFEGDGVATGDDAKFVAGTNGDCSAPGISLLNIQKEFDDTLEMAIYLYENIPGITVGSFQFGADRASAGLSRVLCYRFGSEKFFYYDNFRLDVKTIWGLLQVDKAAGGQPNVAVVDELKMIAIDGVGVSATDKVKWIDGDTAQNDQACEDLPAQGLFARTISVFANRTMWFPFEYGSQGKPWKLCYKFDDEPYRFYSSITVSVKTVTGLLDSAYPNLTAQGTVAVVGQSKTWKPVGSGVQAGDRVKFVPRSVISSADCGTDAASTSGGSSLMRVAGSDLVFTGMFTLFPASLTDLYHVCFQFQDEPFAYVKGLDIATYGIIGIDRKTFLVGASTPLQITGFRLASTDRLGWTSDKSITGCASVFSIVSVLDARAVVTFDQSYDSLALCYSFDRNPFVLFPSITASVVVADVWVPSTMSIVAGVTVQIRLSGTFGLTASSDQVAWVPSDALSCSSTVMAQYASVMPSSVDDSSASTTSLARAGTSIVSVTFVSPVATTTKTAADALSTWKLCYKFGNVPDYVMFGDVLCDVLSIQRIDLIESQPTTTGTTMTFQFIGIGQQDFDLAKWIDLSNLKNPSDADCDSQFGVGGSATMSVISGAATFDFSKDTVAMSLCYKFKDQPSFKLFSNLPVKDVTTRSTTGASLTTGGSLGDSSGMAAPPFVLNRDIATVSLKLDKNINDVPPGSPAETAFKTDFAKTLSSALGIDLSRIEILELLEGSVIVKFKLLPSDNVADPLVHEVVQDLQTQLLDPTSALLTQGAAVIALADPASALSSQIEASTEVTTTTTTSSTAFSVRGYQRAGLFTFATDTYSITEKTSRLLVRVLRQQGTSAVITLPFRLESTTQTARYGDDYRITSPSSVDLNAMFLRFEIGDVEQTIEIQVVDDKVKEAHFEYFKLVLGDPGAPDAALGATTETTVRIYDYDDGEIVQQTRFPAPTDRRFNLLGWNVVENGDSMKSRSGQLRVDSNGIFAVDQVVGNAEYNQKCDLASPTGACGFTCEVGASLAATANWDASYRVLNLNGDSSSFVSTAHPVPSFPTSAFTVSFWIRTTHRSRDACILSYVLPSSGPEDGDNKPVVLAICDPTNLHFALDALDTGSEPHERRGSLATFVDVTDGAWHFIAAHWSAADGRVRVLDNGMLAFDGGPYRIGYAIASGGFFVVGQLATSCATNDSPSTSPVSCKTIPERGLTAELQHVNLWSRVLSRSELLRQLQWPLKIVTNGLVLGWNFDRLALHGSGAVDDLSTRGVQQKNTGFVSCSDSLSCAKAGVLPSLAPGFPCGPVYRNVWHFSASPSFVAALASSYGGRLQYRMLAPSANGEPRALRGQISIFDGVGNHVSLALGGFPLPTASGWTYYSAVLREDFGWIDEPAGEPLATEQFQAVLRGATALWIRGDLWGPGENGQGQEVVYLNDIVLFAR